MGVRSHCFLKEEIQIIASEKNLSTLVIEKDYILGWLLSGIDHCPNINSSWIFKGGTCLKKCYFDNYRFSEDLDYSYIGDNLTKDQLSSDFYKILFSKIRLFYFCIANTSYLMVSVKLNAR